VYRSRLEESSQSLKIPQELAKMIQLKVYHHLSHPLTIPTN
jgi:hypothetical protein